MTGLRSDDAGEHVTLPDVRRIRVRALRQSEHALVHDLYARLSPRTRYFRFFSAMTVLPDSVVQLLVGTDSTPALVAEDSGCGESQVVGLASLAAIDKQAAEIGLVVRDDWQRQRVGTLLAMRIIETAEARGFERFVAHVRYENEAVFRMLRTLVDHVSALEVSHSGSPGVAVVRFRRRP